MSTAIHGSQGGALFNGYDLSSVLNELSLEASQAFHDFTGFGAAGLVKVPGLKDGKASGAGWIDTNALTGSLAVFRSLYVNSTPGSGNPFNVLRCLNSSTFATGSLVDFGYFEAGSIAFQFVITELEKLTFQAEASQDAIDHGVSLHALTAETSFPVADAAVDNAAATTNGGVGVVHVTAIAGGAPNILYVIQHSTDGSTWVDLIHFTAVTAANQSLRSEVAAGTTIRRYLRVLVTEGGTTSSVVGVVAFARR